MVAFLDSFRDSRQSVDQFFREQGQRTGLRPEDLAGTLQAQTSVPNTRARLSHAYTLRTSGGRIIGAVFRTEVNQSRTVDVEHEIDPNNHGEPRDLVPQEMTEQTLSIARFDLYSKPMEEALGSQRIVMLKDQFRGFRLREVWRAPFSFLNATGQLFEYAPCFFTRLGRQQESTGDRVVRVNAQLVWLDRDQIA